MKKFVCPVCGYVHEAEEMAADFKCPLCKVPGSKFKVMEEGKLAAVHEYGVYGKTVKNNPDISEEDKKYIFEQLMATSTASALRSVCTCAWPASLIVKAIPRSACTGRRQLGKRLSMLPSSQSSWARTWSPT